MKIRWFHAVACLGLFLLSNVLTSTARASGPFSVTMCPTVPLSSNPLSTYLLSKLADGIDPYPSDFEPSDLACTIARELKGSLGGKSLAEKRAEIMSSANALNEEMESNLKGSRDLGDKIITAVAGANGYSAYSVIALSENPDFGENWFEAYLQLAGEAHAGREYGKIDATDFVNDPKLLSKVATKLSAVDSPKAGIEEYQVEIPAPTSLDPSAVEVRGVKYRKGKYTDEQMSFECTFLRRYHRKASPLFKWLVEQPVGSLGQKEVFLEAVEIYGDAWTALGVMSHLFSRDAHARGARRLSAVANSRLKPLFKEMRDKAGNNYHFWNYMTDVVVDPSFRHWVNAGSFLRETIIDHDGEDRAADKLAIDVGTMINEVLDGQYKCKTEQRL